MRKYIIIVLSSFLLLSCKRDCDGFYFSADILETIPPSGSKYNVGDDGEIPIEVIEVITDSTDYAVTSPLTYRECESVILVIYSINDYEMTARLSKTEKNSIIHYSIAGINLSKWVEFSNEDQFLNSNLQVFKLNDMNDTIMAIKMNGLRIVGIEQDK